MHEYVDERSSSMETTHRDVFACILLLFGWPDETLHVVEFEVSGRATQEVMGCRIDFVVRSLFSDWSAARDTKSRQAALDLPTASRWW